MAYIGRGLDKISNIEKLDAITFDGSQSYSLTKSSVAFTPNSANSLIISINGVCQFGNVTVSGTSVDFGVAMPSTDTNDFILHLGVGVVNTPADGTVTTAKLADDAVTAAKATGFGKIAQVIQTVKTDTFTTNSASFVDVTGMSATITPSATSSKILILYDLSISVNSTQHYIKLLRGSSDIYVGDAASNRKRVTKNAWLGDSNNMVSSVIHFLDSPSTTSATTYKIQGSVSDTNYSLCFNRTQSDGDATNMPRAASSVTLMEVLA
jgi:hypothetical protein